MTPRGWITRVVAAVLCGFSGASLAGDAPLPVLDLSVGMYRVQAEVAHTPETLQRGLMYRTELGQQQGMLFLFGSRGTQCMWMRNTLIPLAVAFLRDDGTIVNIAEMQPKTEDSHCSSEPVAAALEMNAGWFAQRGIKPGARIHGMPARY